MTLKLQIQTDRDVLKYNCNGEVKKIKNDHYDVNLINLLSISVAQL